MYVWALNFGGPTAASFDRESYLGHPAPPPVASLRRSVSLYISVSSEVSTESDIIIQNSPRASEDYATETLRGENKYSILPHILTSREGEYLRVTHRAIGEVRGAYVTCLL